MRYDLTAAPYDVERTPGPAPVRRSYLLCSNPRTGSTLLAEGLHAIGRLGTPIEYFDETGAMADLVERWGTGDIHSYVACLQQRRTTLSGVLGAKVHWYQLQQLAGWVDPPPLPGPCGRERAVVAKVFPECRFVRVTRHDRDRQAVSWAIAEATGRWGDFGEEILGERGGRPQQAVYGFAEIEAFRRRAEAGEDGWTAFFDAAGVTPLQVTYDEIAEHYAGTLARVARYLGVAVTAGDVPRPRLRRQADGDSERLVARYRRDRAAAGS